MTNDTEAFEIGKHVIMYTCRKDHIHRQGEVIVLKTKLVEELQDHSLINERMIMIKLKTAQEPLFVQNLHT